MAPKRGSKIPHRPPPPLADAYLRALDAWLAAGPSRNDTIALDLVLAVGAELRGQFPHTGPRQETRPRDRDIARLIALLRD